MNVKNKTTLAATYVAEAAPKVEIAYTFRDWRQSLFSMQPSIDYVSKSHPNSSNVATRIQTGGGTDYDLTAGYGRNPSQEIRAVMGAHKENIQEALWRGIVGLGYGKQHPTVHKPMLRLFAKAGLNKVQNFHGLNDKDFTDPIDQAVRELREEEGFDIESVCVLSIEDNVNYNEDKLIEFAKHRINNMGCTEIYLKSASGRVSPDDARSLVDRLMKEFPASVPIKLHAHDTYMEAVPYYIAAAEAAVKHGRSIIVDAVPDEVAGNTSQPSMTDVQDAFVAHPAPRVRAMAPMFDDKQRNALEADRKGLLETRILWGDAEAEFDPETLDLMYLTRSPGGADAALKKMVSTSFAEYEWTDAKRLIFKTQVAIDAVLGSENQITPFARNKNLQASMSILTVMDETRGSNRDALPNEILRLTAQVIQECDPVTLVKKSLHVDTAAYLAGELGGLPESTDQSLIDAGTAQFHARENFDPPSYDEAKRWLAEDGVLPADAIGKSFVPDDDQEWNIVMAATLWNGMDRERGRKLVNQYVKGENSPAPIPDFPDYLKGPVIDDMGGPAEIESIALHAMNIARSDYQISRMDRLKVEIEDDLTVGKEFYTERHKDKIESSYNSISLSMKIMLTALREKYANNREFCRAVSYLNTAIDKHCKSKGLSQDRRLPKVTINHLREYGVRDDLQVVENDGNAWHNHLRSLPTSEDKGGAIQDAWKFDPHQNCHKCNFPLPFCQTLHYKRYIPVKHSSKNSRQALRIVFGSQEKEQ